MKKYAAELIGTFVLVLGGVGSAVLAGSHIGYLGVSFAFGPRLSATNFRFSASVSGREKSISSRSTGMALEPR